MKHIAAKYKTNKANNISTLSIRKNGKYDKESKSSKCNKGNIDTKDIIKTTHINPFIVLNVSLYVLAALCFMIYTTEQSYTFAEGEDEDLGYDLQSVDASVTVGTACTFTGTITSPHTANISNGIYSDNIGTTVLNTKCNDSGGYALYAIGYTDNEYGNTDLSSDISTTYNIPTGTATSGNASNWAMKLNQVPGTTPAVIENGYNNYNIVPDDYTKIATLNTVTDTPSTSSVTGSSVSTTYSAYISPTQPAGTYSGKVKYTLVHPSTAPKPEKPTLYDEIKALVKKDASGNERTQSAADLKQVITKPTSGDPATDTSNSGVYKYDAATFGAASDASNDYAIYYYRGILDSNLDDTSESSYGSNGDGAYYPNYVRLGDTCWRIVRTTGSGGTKMIYNGSYSGGTTANSCANAQANAQVTTSAFNGDSSTNKQAVRIGYTYNSNFATNIAYTDTIANVFGSNANPSANNTDSTIKDYIEDEWFTSAIGSIESKLEPSAGYCNDRTVYDGTSPYTQQAEDTNVKTYGTSVLAYLRFGSNVRNMIANSARTLTLGCARNTVDLYTTSAATDGNKQLSRPVALLTADEAALAGSGGDGRTSTTTHSSNYSYSSYLRSGSNFWLLSPHSRDSGSNTGGFTLNSSGKLSGITVRSAYGARPSISLNHETTVKDGSGTATDPWIINE